MSYLNYKGIRLWDSNEVKEYLLYFTKAPSTVIDNFFIHLTKKLNKLETFDINDLLYNFIQHKKQTASPFDFLVEIFGNYHLANGHSLMIILESIENKDDQYLDFKEYSIRKNIQIAEENISHFRDRSNKAAKDTEDYKWSLKMEIRHLENKRKYTEELDEFLKTRKQN